MKRPLNENLVHPTNDELKELQKFDYKEVMKGISIEKEHTKDERVAARIALDHLKENPHYYRELAKAQIEDVMSYDFFAILEGWDDWDEEPAPTKKEEPAPAPKKQVKTKIEISPTSGRAKYDPSSGLSRSQFFNKLAAERNRLRYNPVVAGERRAKRGNEELPKVVAVSNRGNIIGMRGRQDRITPETAIPSSDKQGIQRAQLDASWRRARTEIPRSLGGRLKQRSPRREIVQIPRDKMDVPDSVMDSIMKDYSGLSEEVAKTLSEFFGSNFKPAGSFKTSPKGSTTRYSWTAAPKNGKLGSKKAAPPDAGHTKSGPGIVDRIKGAFKARADAKERKVADASKFVAAKAQADSGNRASVAKAFSSFDKMAPSKAQGDYSQPSIEKKPGFKAPSMPKAAPKKAEEPKAEAPKAEAPATEAPKATVAPRKKGETTPARIAQAKVLLATRAAKRAAKEKASPKAEAPKAKATPPPPPQPGKKQPPPPPQPEKKQPPQPPAPRKRVPSWAFGDSNQGLTTSIDKDAKQAANKLDLRKGLKKAGTPKAEAPKSSSKLTLDQIKNDLNLGTKVPKAEAPKAEAPKAEAPKAEAPKAAPSLDDRLNKLRADNASTLARAKVDSMVKDASSGPKLLGPASSTPAPKGKAPKGKKAKAAAPPAAPAVTKPSREERISKLKDRVASAGASSGKVHVTPARASGLKNTDQDLGDTGAPGEVDFNLKAGLRKVSSRDRGASIASQLRQNMGTETAKKRYKKAKKERSFNESIIEADEPDYDTPTFQRNQQKDKAQKAETSTADTKGDSSTGTTPKPKATSTTRFTRQAKTHTPPKVSAGGGTFDTSKSYFQPTKVASTKKAAAKAAVKKEVVKQAATESPADKAARKAEKAARREAESQATTAQRIEALKIQKDLNIQRISDRKTRAVRSATAKAGNIAKGAIVGSFRHIINTAKNMGVGVKYKGVV